MIGNMKINTDAALDDARQIDTIIQTIADCMQELDAVIKANIPEEVRTDWSETVKENWERYYNQSVQQAMEEMKLSAQNVRTAVESALAYSQER